MKVDLNQGLDMRAVESFAFRGVEEMQDYCSMYAFIFLLRTMQRQLCRRFSRDPNTFVADYVPLKI